MSMAMSGCHFGFDVAHRRFYPSHGSLPAQDVDHLEYARADGFAGEGHPYRLGDFAQFQAGGFHDVFERRLQVLFFALDREDRAAYVELTDDAPGRG